MPFNTAMPILPPTFLALTPPRRMWPGYPMPRFEAARNAKPQGLAEQRANQHR